jgi:cephalosporin-C deacetylase-like acetyl esterase
MRVIAFFMLCLLSGSVVMGQDGGSLPGTGRLTLAEPLDVVMVRGINAFAEAEIGLSRERRGRYWTPDYSTPLAYQKSIEPNRQRFRKIIGTVEERYEKPVIDVLERVRGVDLPNGWYERVPVADGVHAEFVSILGGGPHQVIVVPDADWAPEQVTSEVEGLAEELQVARRLADRGIGARVLRLANRSTEFSGRPETRYTNQSHREFLYRPAFELGRHIIGYEVQKILRAVDLIDREQPVIVWGIGEGGLLAMYAAAIDPRIQLCVVSGYFQEREGVWQEPIYRNVWRLVDEFGDAEIAALIAPRRLIIEACDGPEIAGPSHPTPQRSGAAPGRLRTPSLESVEREYARAKSVYERLGMLSRIRLIRSDVNGRGPCGCDEVLQAISEAYRTGAPGQRFEIEPLPREQGERLIRDRQRELVEELRLHTQRLLHLAAKERDKLWAKADRSSLAAWEASAEEYRRKVYDELIGRIPYPLLPANPRSRQVIDEPTHTGHEVVLDVFQSEAAGSEPIIAGGILLVPKDLRPGEKRPCVVCQHGLEGTPMDTIVTDPSHPGYRPYKGFSTQLVKQGYIVYAPQNPYRGRDEFRVIQRKSNPLGRSLFSYIIPQHQQTLNWLATLPYVDSARIAFYGLSYGGKTAMRVPPLLPPQTNADGTTTPGYCLSICSADFNEWILKNASTEDRYSYVFTNEYEIFEWNMGHIANYAELASLMTPRPFMVERGHDDGVAPDEWVAWEFAKVKRHYDRLGIGERAEMEVFNGPHTINGKGTFEFLRRHLGR